MTFKLSHPVHGKVETDSARLRDRYLRRGFTLANPKPKPQTSTWAKVTRKDER